MVKKKRRPTRIEPEKIEKVVEAPMETVEPIIELEATEAKVEPKKSLDDRLLEYYRNAEVGTVTLEGLKRDLGANEEKLGQAWDRLYNAGVIEFSKFVKSCETYP